MSIYQAFLMPASNFVTWLVLCENVVETVKISFTIYILWSIVVLKTIETYFKVETLKL